VLAVSKLRGGRQLKYHDLLFCFLDLAGGFIVGKSLTEKEKTVNTYKLKTWVGPTMVSMVAETMQEAGIEVLIRGTEHIVFTAEGESEDAAFHNALVDIEKALGFPVFYRKVGNN